MFSTMMVFQMIITRLNFYEHWTFTSPMMQSSSMNVERRVGALIPSTLVTIDVESKYRKSKTLKVLLKFYNFS